MATKNVTWKMTQRKGTAAQWESANPILAEGEFGYDTTNKKVKIGDGVTRWNDLLAIGEVEEIPTFAEGTWAAIAKAAAKGKASEYFAVGDEKTIKLSTNEQITLVILGFNHDDLADGSGKAKMTIGMKHCLATTYKMNSSNSNAGGWDQSAMRTSTMATLFSQLPADLQAVIKEVKKKATAGSKSTNITQSTDKLFLFSEVEIDGTTSSPYSNEGTRYEYWRTVKDGTVAANRIKNTSNGGGSACTWWLRSPHTGVTNSFRCVDNDGSVYYYYASNAFGVSFGFCV